MCPFFQGSQQNRVHGSEARIFWLALILCPVLWCLFFIFALFGLHAKWLVLLSIAIILSGSNLYGYIKCKMGKEQNFSTATSDFLKKQVMQNVNLKITFHFFFLKFTFFKYFKRLLMIFFFLSSRWWHLWWAKISHQQIQIMLQI